MSDDAPKSLKCSQCTFEGYNQPHLKEHIFTKHELPELIPIEHEAKVAVETAYYYHVVPGQCEIHKATRVLCIHTAADNTVADLKLYCLACLIADL